MIERRDRAKRSLARIVLYITVLSKPRALLLVAAALVTLGIAVQQHYRVTQKLQDPLGGHINDFDRWMIMTPKFVDDRVDYVNDQLPTPPVTLIALAPFSRLSRPWAQFAWVCLKAPLACLVFALAIGIVRRSGARVDGPGMALVLAGWWLPVVLDMQEGQTNFLALLPLVAGLYLAQEESSWGDLVAGVLIGLAIAVKVTPAIFAAYFLWKRRWIVALAAVAGLALWLVAVPAAVFGWDQNVRWLTQWASIMIVPYVMRGTVVYAMSQSFGSFALRLLSAVPVFESTDRGFLEGHYMNVFALSTTAVFQIVRATMIAVAVLGLVWTRRRLITLRSPRYVLEIGAVAAFMLWFSERTWVHHYVSFVLTLSAAAMIVSDAAQPEMTRRLTRAALVLFSATTFFASEAGYLFGASGVDWAKGVGVFLWPSVLVTAAAVSRLQRATDGSVVQQRLPVFRYWSDEQA
jgi:alpha-1,2-mannosyltransferase